MALLQVGVNPSNSMTVRGLVICLFVISLQISTCDLLSEAKYAEKVKENPKHGPALLTYVWFGMRVGGSYCIWLPYSRLWPQESISHMCDTSGCSVHSSLLGLHEGRAEEQRRDCRGTKAALHTMGGLRTLLCDFLWHRVLNGDWYCYEGRPIYELLNRCGCRLLDASEFLIAPLANHCEIQCLRFDSDFTQLEHGCCCFLLFH